MKPSSILTVVLCLVVLAIADGSDHHQAYRFTAFDVPTELGSYTSAYGINNAGIVVGNFLTPDGNLDGFVFQRGRFTDVTVPGASPDDRGALNDVNDRGQAVGGFADAETGIEHSFIRNRLGEITILADAVPDAPLTEATGINNSGMIVGFYFDANFSPHGFILLGGEYTTYDYPGATRTILTRVNERGQISGIRLDADGHRRGFVLENGDITSIDVPGSANTRTGGINNRGQIVGYYDDAQMISHGFLLEDGMYRTLDFPGASDTTLLDINDSGVIAGTYDGFSRGLIAAPTTGD